MIWTAMAIELEVVHAGTLTIQLLMGTGSVIWTMMAHVHMQVTLLQDFPSLHWAHANGNCAVVVAMTTRLIWTSPWPSLHPAHHQLLRHHHHPRCPLHAHPSPHPVCLLLPLCHLHPRHHHVHHPHRRHPHHHHLHRRLFTRCTHHLLSSFPGRCSRPQIRCSRPQIRRKGGLREFWWAAETTALTREPLSLTAPRLQAR